MIKASIISTLLAISLPCACHAAVERIIESFNGDGQFMSTNGTVAGLDNPGWTVFGDGLL